LNTQYTVKAVLEKLNQEIKELDQLQVYKNSLIKNFFVKQYKLCKVYENSL